MQDQPRELTVDELREQFTDHVNTLIHYWSQLPRETGHSDEQDRAGAARPRTQHLLHIGW